MNVSTPTTQRRKVLALMLPLLLLLSGCMKFDLNVNIKSEDDATLEMVIVDSMGFLELETEGCGEYSDDVSDSQVEEFTEDGAFGCRISGNIGGSAATEDFGISKEGDELVFRMGNLDTGFSEDEEIDLDDPMMEAFAPDVSISVTFPGSVTYASEGGQIDGSTVTWTGLEALITRVEARGEASGGLFGGGSSSNEEGTEEDPPVDEEAAGEEDPAGGAAADDGEATTTDDEVATTPDAAEEDEASTGLPTWVVVLLGVLLLLVIFLIVMVARRQKKTPGAEAAQYPAQAAAHHPGQYAPQQSTYPQYPPQPQHPQQWDQSQQHPQQWGQQAPQQPGQWDQTQQMPPQQHWDEGNNGGRPPQQ